MRRNREAGFTLLELIVSIVVLAVGLLMLAGGGIVVTRDLYRSKQATLAVAQSNAYLDWLRNLAASTNPPCTAAGFTGSGGTTNWNDVLHSWSITATGTLRTVKLISTYNLAAGRTHVDTSSAVIGC